MPVMRKKPSLKPSRPQAGSGEPIFGSVFQDAVLEQARRNGLLSGEKSEHVSFRTHPALLEAAKRETGITSTSELGVLALAALTRPDPFVEFIKKNRGRLGPDHTLDY